MENFLSDETVFQFLHFLNCFKLGLAIDARLCNSFWCVVTVSNVNSDSKHVWEIEFVFLFAAVEGDEAFWQEAVMQILVENSVLFWNIYRLVQEVINSL